MSSYRQHLQGGGDLPLQGWYWVSQSCTAGQQIRWCFAASCLIMHEGSSSGMWVYSRKYGVPRRESRRMIIHSLYGCCKKNDFANFVSKEAQCQASSLVLHREKKKAEGSFKCANNLVTVFLELYEKKDWTNLVPILLRWCTWLGLLFEWHVMRGSEGITPTPSLVLECCIRSSQFSGSLLWSVPSGVHLHQCMNRSINQSICESKRPRIRPHEGRDYCK